MSSATLKLLTPAAILGLHTRLLADHGGQIGMPSPLPLARVHAGAEAIRERTQSVSALAAYYLAAILREAPFYAGNKRTAWIVASVAITKNGKPLMIGDYAMAMRVVHGAAAGYFSEDELETYFARLIRQTRQLDRAAG